MTHKSRNGINLTLWHELVKAVETSARKNKQRGIPFCVRSIAFGLADFCQTNDSDILPKIEEFETGTSIRTTAKALRWLEANEFLVVGKDQHFQLSLPEGAMEAWRMSYDRTLSYHRDHPEEEAAYAQLEAQEAAKLEYWFARWLDYKAVGQNDS